MLNKNSKILLTVQLRGELGTTVSNTSSKEVISKVKTSPFESHIKDSKGIPTGRYITPKGHYKSPDLYNERKETTATRKVNICGDAVMHYASQASCPYSIKKNVWEKLSQVQRIEAHLALNAEGLPFTYQIIE